ncbi:MAG: ATP-dependent Lon protease [Parcubacteria group bacterium Licking1014_17]|nr:MAG: ATP-dependent Lon protease [Parcubacteria group bacterium Licking1014_17]
MNNIGNDNLNPNREFPVIPLKNVALFPRVAIPLLIQREKSMASLAEALENDKHAVFVAQKNIYDDITEKDLFMVGTIGKIFGVHKLPDGSSKVDVEGLMRVRVLEFTRLEPSIKAVVEPFPIVFDDKVETQALIRATVDQFKKLIESRSSPGAVADLINIVSQVKDYEQIIYLITINLNLELKDQQDILESVSGLDVLKKINGYLSREIEILEAEKRVVKETRKSIGKMQKEMFLREQMRSIEKELGMDGERSEFDTLRAKIKASGMPKDVEVKALKELSRLEKMPSFSPEISYLRTYLDWLVELPWSRRTTSKIDIKEASKILDQDHYGLTKVKERILEYLAVQKQVGKIKGPILCFVGPPGVGKTSIGRSIARALGRKFIRVSLGGLRDEAEIRGHRRTYVGALPGRIIQGINTASTRNPVFMLDEIDKLGIDFRGDPSAALLEALDPAQNFSFSDHYLEVPFDLSDVLFITTANVLDTIPYALRDRLEIIEFPGYTEQEKTHIATQFLLPKIFEEHGLKKDTVSIPETVIKDVIRNHTQEAGVRELERQLAAVSRKITRKIVEKKIKGKIKVTNESLHGYLGPIKYTHQEAEKGGEVGVVTGLAWTPVGGEVLSVEATKMQGRGKLTLTGQLGEVMRESAYAALSYARSRAAKLGIKTDFYKEDIHIHVPTGAIKKDGPSAGITMATALISLFTNKPVKRGIGMTGEITLRGKVLEIGGVKEKILAAHRARLKNVILPKDNKKDMEDIPAEIRKDLKFIFVSNIDEVLKAALGR